MVRSCPHCHEIINDERLVACPNCHSSLRESESDATLLSPGQLRQVVREARKQIVMQTIAVLGVVSLITGLSMWSIKNHLEVLLIKRIAAQFEEPRIVETLQRVANGKAEQILQQQVKPSVDNFNAQTKALLDQVESSIAEIKDRIATQGATIDLIVKDAAESKRLTEELAQKNALADERLKQLDIAVKSGLEAVAELKRYTEFNSTVLAAQSDSRPAFDQLRRWAEDRSYPLSNDAGQAWAAVMDSHESPFTRGGFKVPWSEGVDPAKLSFAELKAAFADTMVYTSPQVRIGILEHVWNQKNIPKKDKLLFLVVVMQSDPNLQVVEYAARYFKQESKDDLKNLYIEGHVKWWNEHKGDFQ